MKIVCVNGLPRSGKSKFEFFCMEHKKGLVQQRSTVDKVKEIAKECGWDGKKDLKSRKFLSDLKDLTTEFNDLAMNDIKKWKKIYEDELSSYGMLDVGVLLCDVREPKELQRMREELNATCILIKRDDILDEETSNHADSEVFDFDYDYIIENNGTLEDLKAAAEEFIDNFENWKNSENSDII